MTSTYRSFSPKFNGEAIQMVFLGRYEFSEVARDRDIRPDMLRRW